jgi:1-acyl-sn-glycerol-3-phosphate acyltransferase
VLGLGLLMAASIAVAERLGLNTPLERRQRWTRRFMQRLVAALPFEVTVHGELPQRPMLWVCNHVSWTDIPLLGMLTPLSFLSKAEVRHWPVAGWLAEKAGTLFIRRGGGDAQRLREQISAQLGQQRPLLIFPEGTTTDGRGLRTFHGRLLAGAIDQCTPVQPVAIQYLRDGQPDPIAPFIGEDDLVSHLLRLFAQPRGQVVIQLLPAVESAGMERAALAFLTQQAVQVALFGEALPAVAPRRQARAA